VVSQTVLHADMRQDYQIEPIPVVGANSQVAQARSTELDVSTKVAVKLHRAWQKQLLARHDADSARLHANILTALQVHEAQKDTLFAQHEQERQRLADKMKHDIEEWARFEESVRNDSIEFEDTIATDRQRRNEELEKKKEELSYNLETLLQVECQRLSELQETMFQKMEKQKNDCQAGEEEILRIKFEERKQNLMQIAPGATQSPSAHTARGHPLKSIRAAIGPPVHTLLPLPPLRTSRPPPSTMISSQGGVERSSMQMQRTRGLLVAENLEQDLHSCMLPSACDSGSGALAPKKSECAKEQPGRERGVDR